MTIVDDRAGTLIRTTGLRKSFRGVRAVRDVELDLGGGVVGLLGPNGAGKTTLLRMLATVLAPDTGELRLLGRDPRRPAERLEIRRRLGYLPQAPSLYGGFTVLEMVEYVAVLKEQTDATARRHDATRVLESVGLGDVMHRRIRTLSGGMRQRVALAAALLGKPELLVLDEPATGLDPEQRIELRSLLSETARRGTVVLSTHNTSEVAALCQRVLVMRDGQIHYDGTPQALRTVAEGRVWEADEPDPRAARSWMTAEGRHRHVGVPPDGVEPAVPTLEDGYLFVTRGGR
jgi:ABC-2 type transport system ATP-binding protein